MKTEQIKKRFDYCMIDNMLCDLFKERPKETAMEIWVVTRFEVKEEISKVEDFPKLFAGMHKVLDFMASKLINLPKNRGYYQYFETKSNKEFIMYIFDKEGTFGDVGTACYGYNAKLVKVEGT